MEINVLSHLKIKHTKSKQNIYVRGAQSGAGKDRLRVMVFIHHC